MEAELRGKPNQRTAGHFRLRIRLASLETELGVESPKSIWSVRTPDTNRESGRQGNLDPDVLQAPRVVVEREVKRLLNSMQGDPGYIFNLGHGIAPDVPVDNVKTLVETVKNHV